MKILVVEQKFFIDKIASKWESIFPEAEIQKTSDFKKAEEIIENEEFSIVSLDGDLSHLSCDSTIFEAKNGCGWHLAKKIKGNPQIYFVTAYHKQATELIPGSLGMDKNSFLKLNESTYKDPIFEPLEKLGAKIA